MKTWIKGLFWFLLFAFILNLMVGCAKEETSPKYYSNFQKAYTYKESRPELAKLMADGHISRWEAGSIRLIYDETLKRRKEAAEERDRAKYRNETKAFMEKRK